MKAREVIRIFEDFEEDVEDEDLTDYEKVKGVLKDVEDKKDRSLWKTLDGYDEQDYMTFKGSVLEHYLGTRKTTKYFLEQRLLLSFFANSTMAKIIQKRILQQPDLKDQMIPPMKRAFKKARHVVEEMLEKDEDDLFGWPSIMGPNSPVEILMDEEIGEDKTQVAGVEQELQGFEDGEEDLELRVLEEDDDAQRIPGYFDRATGSVEEMEAEMEDIQAPVERLPAAIENVPEVFENVPGANTMSPQILKTC